MLCSMSETIYVASKNPFACFNSFIIWAKIALFVYKHKYQNSPKHQLEIVFEVRLCHRFSPILIKTNIHIMIKSLIPLEFHERQQFIEIRVPKIPAQETKLRDKRNLIE